MRHPGHRIAIIANMEGQKSRPWNQADRFLQSVFLYVASMFPAALVSLQFLDIFDGSRTSGSDGELMQNISKQIHIVRREQESRMRLAATSCVIFAFLAWTVSATLFPTVAQPLWVFFMTKNAIPKLSR